MSRNWQIYYNAVLGAIGGLIGWFIVGQFETGEWEIYSAYLFIGAGVGICIGAATGAVEGVIIKKSVRQSSLGLFYGGGTGLFSGAIGLLLGQVAFLMFQGGWLGRTLGWVAFGLFLGMGEGVVSRRFKRASYGAMGGLLAGFIGGTAYEGITQLFLEQSNEVQMVVSAIGLIIIGASLGGLTPLSIDMIARVGANRGLIRVITGSRAGLEIPIIDIVTLGSYDGCDAYLPGDEGIEGKQSQIGKSATGFTVKNIGHQTSILVDGRPILPNASSPLTTNSTIQMSETIVQFAEN